MKEANVVTNRIRIVEQEIAKTKSRLKTMQDELVELRNAARVLARLTNSRFREEPTSPEGEEPFTQGSLEIAATIMTVPELIFDILMDADRQGHPRLTPKMITDRLVEKHGAQPAGQNVNSVAWRMWKQGRLDKENNTYSVRKSDSSVSQSAVESRLTDEGTMEQDRKAGPGGGP
jgi:hypothetical protein